MFNGRESGYHLNYIGKCLLGESRVALLIDMGKCLFGDNRVAHLNCMGKWERNRRTDLPPGSCIASMTTTATTAARSRTPNRMSKQMSSGLGT